MEDKDKISLCMSRAETNRTLGCVSGKYKLRAGITAVYGVSTSLGNAFTLQKLMPEN